MPKLSNSSLAKRFTCQYCDNSFRTRQGLSGHIQFKHKLQQPPSVKKHVIDELIEIPMYKSAMKDSGFLESQSYAGALIPIQWGMTRDYCTNILHIIPNNQDYKNYVIASMACMFQNENLKKDLVSIFKNLLEDAKHHE